MKKIPVDNKEKTHKAKSFRDMLCIISLRKNRQKLLNAMYKKRSKTKKNSKTNYQLHLIAFNMDKIISSFVSIICLKLNNMKKYFLISENVTRNEMIEDYCIYAFPTINDSQILEYITMLRKFNQSDRIVYFNSFCRQAAGIKLTAIYIGETIMIYELPDSLIEVIDFSRIPYFDLNDGRNIWTCNILQLESIVAIYTELCNERLQIHSKTITNGFDYYVKVDEQPRGIGIDGYKC